MAQAFREAQARGPVELELFGSIIESGEGAEVPPEVQKRMERDFGVRHDFEDRLAKAVTAHTAGHA